MNFNFQPNHKRTSSVNNSLSSGSKVLRNFSNSKVKTSGLKEQTPRRGIPTANLASASKNGRGSLFNSLPLKLEGELSIGSSSKNPSRAHSKNTYNRTGEISGLKTQKRTGTPNSSKGFAPSANFHTNSKLIYPASKLKNLIISPVNNPQRKKMKTYFTPKTTRDKLNTSNVLTKNKLHDLSNNSIDPMAKTRISLNKNSNPKRSATPNLQISRSKSKEKPDLNEKSSKSNIDQNRMKNTLSKSPNNNMSRMGKKLIGLNNNVTKNSPLSSSTLKNPFDSTMMKQFQDFKNNKNTSSQILSSYSKKIKNPKMANICTNKFGTPNVKKVVTGSLLGEVNVSVSVSVSNNNNTSDVTSNPTIKSKIEITNKPNVTNITNIPNINMPSIDLDSKKETLSSRYQEDKENNIRNNSLKENKLDFKEISTSPLLKKKSEPKINLVGNNNSNLVMNGMLSNPILNRLSINKEKIPVNEVDVVNNQITSNANSRVNSRLNSNLHSQINSFAVNPSNHGTNNSVFSDNNYNSTLKKSIKLIHEFSKVGFSGYGVKKVNQDNYFVFKNFVGNPNHYFMAVCDGHGVLGHEVSGYLRENLPITLNNQLKSKNKNVLIHNVNSIIEEVFLDINYKLQTSESIDTTFSGSTCVSLIFTPEKIITANVGDSRAVIGRCVKGEWISHDLTRDHKPNEKDEAARIKKRGGRIQPFRDEDNEFIGPPRVWLKEEEIPGLAMTRSFGDRVAASVGVIAEPEIIEYKFHEDDKFMIIASDGVWEFIQSHEGVDIIKDYYLKNDIVGCCEFLYKESSTRWLKEEEVIDDISMIIVFFD